MANFQFTVRATDSDGAYADRNFGITVNNTRVERYMVVDHVNAYTSPDLVNWSTRNGQGGWDCAYGNGMWLIVSNNMVISNTSLTGALGGGASATIPNSALVVRKSVDGVNFATVSQSAGTLTILNPSGTTVAATPSSFSQTFGRLSFSNGFFWLPMFFGDIALTATNINTFIARSVDGVTWQLLPSPAKGQYTWDSNNVGHNFRHWSKVQDSGTDIFVASWGSISAGASVNLYGWKSSDLGVTWTPVTDSTGKANGTTTYQGSIVTRINGLWLAGTPQNNVPFMVSNDGVNWSPCNSVANHTSGQLPHTVVYANGTLYAMTNQNNSTTVTASGYMLSSTDGINWLRSTSPWSMNVNSTSYQQYTNMFYKNGFLVTGNNSVSGGTHRPLGYVFAGTTDSTTYPSNPGASTQNTPLIPFNFVNGMAAMGS